MVSEKYNDIVNWSGVTIQYPTYQNTWGMIGYTTVYFPSIFLKIWEKYSSHSTMMKFTEAWFHSRVHIVEFKKD